MRKVRVPGESDVVIVRNITGGAYGSPDQRIESDGVRPAEDRLVLDPVRVQEVFDIAVDYARRRSGSALPERRQGERVCHQPPLATALKGNV